MAKMVNGLQLYGMFWSSCSLNLSFRVNPSLLEFFNNLQFLQFDFPALLFRLLSLLMYRYGDIGILLIFLM